MLNSFAAFIRTFRISPGIAFRKAVNSISKKVKNNEKRLLDLENPTFHKKPDWLTGIANSFYCLPSIQTPMTRKGDISTLSDYIMEHKFNLLGSGRINVKHGVKTLGLEGFNYNSEEVFENWEEWLKNHIIGKNLSECEMISRKIENDYIPIDWQLDFKSGFRWSELEWYKDIIYGNIPGADIKVPWEMGRMQHLLVLAYAAGLEFGVESAELKTDKYSLEFRNEVLDFIVSNPPRFGVQWMSSMDVGIRAINWLVAFDLFRNIGIEFDDDFNRIFAKSIYEHGLHILNNLEWSAGLRGNHYLTNIASLLYISSYLPVNEETTLWLAFALQELNNEIFEQFLADGGNFEASTCYHAFSFEMLIHSVSIALALPQEKKSALTANKIDSWANNKRLKKYDSQIFMDLTHNQINENGNIHFSDKFWEHLFKVAEFSQYLSSQSCKSIQIGDNDSGRLIKFTPEFVYDSKENAFIADNHQISLVVFSELFGLEASKVTSNNNNFFECEIIREMIKTKIDKSELYNGVINSLKKDFINKFDKLCEDDIEFKAFPEFGLYMNCCQNYLTTIRCGQIGQRGKGGHAHNDQLSLTLSVKTKEIIVDPGTYLYTAVKEKRNYYRSTRMHNTLFIDGFEQNEWSDQSKDDLFWFKKDKSRAKVLQFSEKLFVGEQFGFGKPHKRIITFDYNVIEGVDICDVKKEKNVAFHLAPDVEITEIEHSKLELKSGDIRIFLYFENSKYCIEDYNYSPGYGVLKLAKNIILKNKGDKINWKIEII